MKRRTRLMIAPALLLSLTSIAGLLTAITNDAAAATGETTVFSVSAGVLAAEEAYAEGVIDIVLGETITVSGEGATVDGTTVRITDAKKVTITLVDGTTNYRIDGKSDAENDAALFTNDTPVINGGGTLVVTGNSNEGISSDDDIVINSGTVRVMAVDDALNAHD
ncbi:MAG: carbohydrate-binding domain-containing protein, partial [Actinomycetia bacterium]|nr:carbohydrate-binding domain-containing protein [Actinomycetes bacterium]